MTNIGYSLKRSWPQGKERMSPGTRLDRRQTAREYTTSRYGQERAVLR